MTQSKGVDGEADADASPFRRGIARVPYRFGAAFGSLVVAGYVFAWVGIPPLDLFLWIVFLVILSIGALLGGGLVLAVRHVARRPRILVPTVAILLVLSLLPVGCYQRAARATPAFLAGADSVQGKVTGRNIFGNLLIYYRMDSSRRGRLVASTKHAHDRFGPGDSIWVYRQREAPNRVDVWPAGPDLHTTVRRLLWMWAIGGVMIAGYGPRVKRRLSGRVMEP